MTTPALIVQGTRDAFGTRDEVPGYGLSDQIEVLVAGGRRPRPEAAQGHLRLHHRPAPEDHGRGGRRLRRRASRPDPVKLATFNVNDINRRLPNLLAWLAAAKPDIVCLQELKATDRQFPRAALAEAGYGAVWKGQTSWNGVAILARGARSDPDQRRTARRSCRSRSALHRGRRQRHPRRLALRPQRQPAAGPEIRPTSSPGPTGSSPMPASLRRDRDSR